MIDLFLRLQDAPQGVHPQQIMREIGITYHHAVPQSIADGWQFFDCKNVPDELPEYLVRMKERTDYRGLVGNGLSIMEAYELNRRLKQNAKN